MHVFLRAAMEEETVLKFFPSMSEDTEENTGGGKVDEVHLFFYDRMMRKKGLNANDIISFHVCDGQEGAKESQSFYVIDIGHTGGSRNAMVDEGIGQNVDIAVDLSLTLGKNINLGLFKEEREEFEHGQVFSGMGLAAKRERSVRLFGVELD
ncbi:hypothetical protein RHGRI_034135 [Rhododendron griersonianum]|uniref:Uncharacterized protein n=1 Tax=Rhododendron griersonianum TaxID=479676 RepID=A0AAV6I564_9ERIC|nr:hypothetical protein RHGRI_034135 [Rhododendron griersonianum]